MNYYYPNPTMDYYQNRQYPPQNQNLNNNRQRTLTNVPTLNPPTNRFVYVKQNFTPSTLQQNPAPKVLVNPHFKPKVYINPQFQHPQESSPKPKIHVNPNMLKSFAAPPSSNVKKPEIKATKTKTVISTRTKLVRVPCNSTPIKVARKRRNSLLTKYKIVRSSPQESVKNRFKLDKRPAPKPAKTIRKKYVYVNRFLSMSLMAKSVLIKQNKNLKKPGFVNINGILYKKSPNSIRKAADTSVVPARTGRYKFVRKSTKLVNTSRSSISDRKSLVKQFKVIRSKKPVGRTSVSKMRKCNIPCPMFRRFGKCKGKDNGACFKLHNPDQIFLCTRFLQGACLDKSCLLSHKVSHEKMPTCKYYLEGLCSRDDCPYLHVKISAKAEICRPFLEGFCKKASQCDKRHQFLCPDFEKTQTCPKKRCPYPHGAVVRKRKVVNALAKKNSVKKDKNKPKPQTEAPDTNNRYYKESESETRNAVIKTLSRNRPKLGTLPAFIPLFEAS